MIGSGKSNTTVGFYTRALRTIINILIEDGSFPKESYPFGRRKFKIPTSRKAKKALSASEIGKILRYECPVDDITNKKQAIDFWIFSFHSNGINFKDIALLKWKNVFDDHFIYVRQKTALTTKEDITPIRVPLNEITKGIVKQWSPSYKHKMPDAYVFDILDNSDNLNVNHVLIDRKVENFIKVSNKWLKRLGEELKLSIPLTTYVARHSYVTAMITIGNAPHEVIRQSIGHTNIKTTQNYIGSLGLDEQRKYADSLLQLAQLKDK